MVDAIWLGTRRRLRELLSENDFTTWIAPLRAATWTPGELTLEVPSVFFRDWLKRRRQDTLERAVAGVTGAPATVRLVVNPALARPAPMRAERPPVATPAPADLGVESRTFDTFVVGAANAMACQAAREVVARPGVRFNPLFIHGGSGLGKSHLLFSVGHGYAVRGFNGSVARISAETFVNEMVSAIDQRRMAGFRQRFRRISTLIVDDVQFLSGKVRSQEEFAHTFNALHDGRCQIVLASDRPPDQLPGIEATLRSRFACGLLVDIQPPDPALRLALVRHKAAALALELPADVVDHLAQHCCDNVRQLEGALTRLYGFRTLAGVEVTMALVQRVLPTRHESCARAEIARIVTEVCRSFEVTAAELSSARRTARIARARHVAMYLCREHTEAPLGTIGAEFGGRDHSTVVHALGVVQRRLGEDAALRAAVSEVRARLKA